MRSHRYNNEDRVISKKILSMILPITLEGILQMTTGIISMAMIGRIDSLAVSALGISNNIFNIIWALFKGIATGASVFVAQAHGASNYEKIRRISIETLIFSLLIVIILQQIVFWNAESILTIFDPSEQLLLNATRYLKIISWGLPFITIVLIVAGIFQGMGNAYTPMKIAIIMNLLNIVFSYTFIFGKLGFPSMGLKGAAYALLIAQTVAAFIGFKLLNDKLNMVNLRGKSSSNRMRFQEVISVYKAGLPVSAERILWQASSLFLTKAILTYGEIAYAAYQLGLQAEGISYMPAGGFSVAATTFIGYAIGAKDMEMGKKYYKKLMNWTIILTIFTGGLLIFFPKEVMRILTNDLDIIEIGAVYLFVMGIVQMPQNIKGVIEGALRGMGLTKAPSIIAMIGLWCIRVPLSLLVAYNLNMDIIFIWIIFGIDLVFRFLCSLILFKRKDVLNNTKMLIGDE
ncbi:MAG: MATE family efflux transporter [Tissierellia bacterium]|nr:MATE family efflux transporter [Tissierellia bacterium]